VIRKRDPESSARAYDSGLNQQSVACPKADVFESDAVTGARAPSLLRLPRTLASVPSRPRVATRPSLPTKVGPTGGSLTGEILAYVGFSAGETAANPHAPQTPQ